MEEFYVQKERKLSNIISVCVMTIIVGIHNNNIFLRKLLDSRRRRNDTKDLWPLAIARSFGVMSA